jgi:hypothetical protein
MKKFTKQTTALRTTPPQAVNHARLADVKGGVLFVVPPVVN